MKLFKNLPIVAGIAASVAFGVEAPVCEEFAGEDNISCTRQGDVAVLLSWKDGVKTAEFFYHGRKAVLETGTDGHVYAASHKRALDLAALPENVAGEDYVNALLDGILQDIGWKDAELAY